MKLIQKIILGTILLSSIFANVSAATQIVEANGDYVLGDGENVIVAKERSKEVAIRNASMKAATFVESVLTVDNGMVSNDEIVLITSNFLQLQAEPEFENLVDEKSIIIRCHVVASIDTDNVEQLINNRTELEEALNRNREYESEINRLNEELEEYKQKLAESKDVDERQKIINEKNINDQNFLATQHWNSGNRFYYEKNYSKAIEEYTVAIDLNANYTEAYNSRGFAYYRKGNTNSALTDFQKVLELNPDNEIAKTMIQEIQEIQDTNQPQHREINRSTQPQNQHQPPQPQQPKKIDPPKPIQHLDPIKPPQVKTPGPDGRPPELPPNYPKKR